MFINQIQVCLIYEPLLRVCSVTSLFLTLFPFLHYLYFFLLMFILSTTIFLMSTETKQMLNQDKQAEQGRAEGTGSGAEVQETPAGLTLILGL